MPLTLRVDPWASEYEGALHIDEEQPEPSVSVDPFVETTDWSVIAPPYYQRSASIIFIDGVRRVDIGAIDEREGRLAYGLFGSFAAGAVACGSNFAQVERREVRRRLVVGRGIKHETIEIEAGTMVLGYEGHAISENGRNSVLQGLQNLMRKLEGQLAREWSERDALIFIDGPLTFLIPFEEPILGYVKSHFREYLQQPEHIAVIYRLDVGCRSPVFRFGEGSTSRYSWYLRLASRRSIEYSLAGVVRVEVSVGVGQEEAIGLANRSTSLLPEFATSPIWDARAPQNLYPLSVLEDDLHHRLGDQAWIRRSIEAYLHQEGAT